MTSTPKVEGRGGGRGGGGGGRKSKGRGRQGGRGGEGNKGRGGEGGDGQTSKKGRSGRGSRGGRGKGNSGGRGGRGGGGKVAKPSPEELEKERLEKEELARQAALQLQRKQKEEEEKQKQEKRKAEIKELDDGMRGAIDNVKQFVDVIHQRRSSREMMAELAAARKSFETNKKKLKTDLKKCTTFVKKIKSGSAWMNANVNNNEVLKDIENLNLSRYVDEIVTAILESKPKVGDLPVLLALCKAMHLKYTDFLPNLIPSMWNVINSKGDQETAKLRRLYLRALTEFHLSGFSTDIIKSLVKCVAEATGAKDGTYNVQDAPLLVAFGKAASPDVFSVTPRSVQSSLKLIANHLKRREETGPEASDNKDTEGDVELPPLRVSDSLAIEAGKIQGEADLVLKEYSGRWSSDEESAHRDLSEYCKGAYQMLSNSLVQTHVKLQKLEKRCEQDRLLAGTLTEAREKGLADARKLNDSLHKSLEALSDILNLSLPHLPEDDETDLGQTTGTGVEVWTKGGEDGDDDFGPFDDEETRAFYCDIPDLLTTVPPALLGMTPESIERKKEENLLKYGDSQEVEGAEMGAMEVTPTPEAELDAEEDAAVDGGDSNEATDNNDKDEESNKDTPHYRLMVLLDQELPECNRREQIDDISERFCTNHGSSKNSRKRLIKALFLVPRSRLDLLPYYSRLTSTLDRVWGELGPALVTEVEQQFHGQTKYKKNLNIDARMRTARYLGELTKFRVAPPIVFLRCMKRCLDDFTGSNVDIACTLLESCGRFLYRLKHTSSRVGEIIESMGRLSKAKNLDERLQSLIKAAFYTVNPPARGPRKRQKEYPPLEAYLRHLLLSRLSPTNSSCSFVAKQIARLPWHDPSADCGALVCRLMLKAARKGRYKTIQSIATVASNLRTQRAAGEATVRLVDAVLEELRWAIEQPNFRDQQRMITYARLLGELYCASQVSAPVVFMQLYDFINVGHEIPEQLREASRKLSEGQDQQKDTENAEYPVYNSSTGVSQTVVEDEEMDESPLETKEEGQEEPKPIAVSEYSVFDPRVPSVKDPPNSAYRVKLVCTLLEVVGKQLASRNNLPRLKGFLTAFQRYLFTKSMLPTDVEFSLLDAFDILDSQWRRATKGTKASESKESGFPRYSTWLDAHNATVGIEKTEALLEQQQRAKLAAGFNHVKDEDDDSSSIDERDEDEDASSYSGKDSVSDTNEGDVENDEDGESNMDDDDDEDASNLDGSTDSEEEDEEAEDEIDEEAYLRQLEEEAFERELRRLTMEALEKGKSASRKLVADYMPSGTHSIKRKPTDSKGNETGAPQGLLKAKDGISFQLLKKGNKGKVEAKELIVPMNTNLALVATKQDDEAARERDEIKQRVLQYEADSAEAEFSGGNVYLEQEKLQVIRNRPLSMEDIDRNFGTKGGNLRPGDKPGARTPGRPPFDRGGRGRGGRGRGGRSSSSGRTLYG